MRVNAPICAHSFLPYSVQKKGTQQNYRKGICGVVFIARERSDLCVLCRGGSQASLSLEVMGTSCLTTPPTTRLLSSWLYRSTLAFHSSGGLTQGIPPGNSFPLTLSCQVA
jgi:hypothetical protein